MFFKNSPRLMLAVIISVVFFSTTTQVIADNERRYITVTGKGEISATPDIAWVSSGVSTHAKTASEALIKNNNLMQVVIQVLRNTNIKDKNIQTSGFSVYPVYDSPKNSTPLKLTSYRVSNTVTVKITDINKLGELLDKLVSSGSNNISGIRLGFDNNLELLNEARKNAIANAKSKAKLYAQAADVDLGDVVSISELNTRLPQPVYRYTEMDQTRMMARPVPVMKGEQNISTSVTVVYELKN